MRVVIKVGGSMATQPEHLKVLMQTISSLCQEHMIVVVPGGGPFAGQVRESQRKTGVSDSTAHWMAIKAMEQFGMLLSQHAPHLETFDGSDISTRMSEGRSFILQPYNLLKSKDELPHSWSVTSDSIAVWVAIQVEADSILLMKSTDELERSVSNKIDAIPSSIEKDDLDHLEKMGVVDEYLREIHSHFKGQLYLMDGRKPQILRRLFEKRAERI
ncbi:MAG: hypothetical protein ACFFD9_07330 [Candidatus Thorarchaeota archaeon]